MTPPLSVPGRRRMKKCACDYSLMQLRKNLSPEWRGAFCGRFSRSLLREGKTFGLQSQDLRRENDLFA